MKKINNYFSHDFNARNDIKLKKVLMQLGLQGIGLYWCIVECLYENDGYLSLDEDIDLLAYELRIDKNIILNLIENFDLFKKNKNRFYSPSVITRLQKISEISEKNRQNIMKRWEKSRGNIRNKNDTNDIQEENESNTTVLETEYYKKENKINEKESKVNNNHSYTTTDDIYSFIEQNFGRLLTPIEYEKINVWLLEFKEEIIKYAISIAVMNQTKTFAYVEGILKNWKGKGYKTIDEIKESSIRGYAISNSKKQEPDDTKEIFDYNWLEDANLDDLLDES